MEKRTVEQANQTLHNQAVIDEGGVATAPLTPEPVKEKLSVSKASVIASVLSTFILRVASRTSFVILSFYLGENFESATIAVIVIEAFYISELLIAPIIGSLSDRRGRKPFMLLSPVVGSIAAITLAAAAFLFPRPRADVFDFELIALLLIILSGRLLEGFATALNAPANLGYLTDATLGTEKLRARVMTAYEVVTVGGIALAIPFGGQVSRLLGVGGFFVVIALYALCYCAIYFFMQESLARTQGAGSHGSLLESFKVARDKRIFTFIPAWLAINALLGAWLALIIIIMAYPTPNATPGFKPGDRTGSALAVAQYVNSGVEGFKFALAGQDADARFPNQLLHGGFSQSTATLIVGAYGLAFIIGMGIWTLIYSRFRRTTMMFIGLAGTTISSILLIFVNSLEDNPARVNTTDTVELFIVIPFIVLAVFMTSGFTPAALTHLAAISETLPGKRGAVMGLYSVLLGVGQLIGTWLGGVFTDLGGFYGLMIYSLILTAISFASVFYMRTHNHDLLKSGGHTAAAAH